MSTRKGLVMAVTFALLAVSPAFAQPLCEGVEACSLSWVTIPEGAWFYQTAVSFDGVDAIQSSPTADNEVSVVGALITGPATVSFMAKVSSEENSDSLGLLVDGQVQGAVSGEMDWFPLEIELPAGEHEVAVLYAKDGSGSAGSDAAWIDNFVVTPTGGIAINNGAASTGSSDVALNLNWVSGSSQIVRMRFSNNGSTWSAWEPLADTKAWTLAPGDGYKTVRVQFRDIDGNVSFPISDYIKVDTTAPTGGIVINNGAWSTLSRDVTLNLNWADGAGVGVSRMRFSNDGATWSAWEAVAPTKAWTLSAWGYRTVRVQFIDRAGNVSAVYNDYINALT